MDSTKYVGRIGALAVAFGIGTAISLGTPAAWADGSTGSGDTGDSPAKTQQSPRGPMSSAGERVRKQVDAGLDDAGRAVKRARTQVEKAQARSEDRRAKFERGVDDSVAQLGKARDRVTPAPDDAQTPRLVPDAVQTMPRRQPQRTATAAMTTEDGADVAPRSAPGRAVAQPPVAARTVAALPSVRDVAPALNVTATRITDVAESIAAPAVVAPAVSDLVGSPVVSALLAATGLSPLLGGSPLAPGPSPLALALLAWTRRESEQTVLQSAAAAPEAQVVAALVAADDVYDANPGQAPAPVVPSSLVGPTDLGLVTGAPTSHWYVAGTDLGIMWDSGYKQNGAPVVYTLFGDTYSAPGMSGDWRNNVLFRSIDNNLSNGLAFDAAVINAGASYPGDPAGTPTWYGTGGAAAGAMQIITDPGLDGLFGNTYTLIPTAAIAVADDSPTGYTQYATVMSVRTWDNPGSWTTNYSAIAYSTDGGQTWTIDPDTARSSGWLRSKTNYVPGDEHFQQNALVYGNPDDPDSWTAAEGDASRERYVYVYGTPSGRQGSAYLARVPESQIRDLGEYQYWAGEKSDGTGNWVTGKPSKAVPVIGASESDFLPRLYKFFDCFTFGLFSTILNGIWVGGLPTLGNVSELSVQYNEYAQRYLVTYTDGSNAVVLRASDTPQGTWSNPVTLKPFAAGWYAPMIHPLSGTSALGAGNEQYLYYNLSNWDEYNVHLMRTDISALRLV